MKKYILIGIALLGAKQLFSADRDSFPIEELSPEIQQMIISLSAGVNLQEYIQNIKNFISTNQRWHNLLNNPDAVQGLLKAMSEQIGVSELVIAYVLDTPGTRGWLAQKDPIMHNTLLKIFGEMTQNRLLSSGFHSSKYFTQLANQLGIQGLLSIYKYLDDGLTGILQLKDYRTPGQPYYNREGYQRFTSPILTNEGIRQAWKDNDHLYNGFKSFGLLLVKLKNQIDWLSFFKQDNYRNIEMLIFIEAAHYFLKEEILPKLSDGPFKQEIVKFITGGSYVSLQKIN